jgi:hypothetical protein
LGRGQYRLDPLPTAVDCSVMQKKSRLALTRTEIAFVSGSNALRTDFLDVFPWGESIVFGVRGQIKLLRAG